MKPESYLRGMPSAWTRSESQGGESLLYTLVCKVHTRREPAKGGTLNTQAEMLGPGQERNDTSETLQQQETWNCEGGGGLNPSEKGLIINPKKNLINSLKSLSRFN